VLVLTRGGTTAAIGREGGKYTTGSYYGTTCTTTLCRRRRRGDMVGTLYICMPDVCDRSLVGVGSHLSRDIPIGREIPRGICLPTVPLYGVRLVDVKLRL
jgi:hypothetical protein